MTVTHAILYARCPDSRSSGTSIDSQIRLLADYATSHGWSYSVAVDSGPGRTRTSLEAALERVTSGEAEVLVVTEPSRLSRDFGEILRIVRAVEASGARVVCTFLGECDGPRLRDYVFILGCGDELRARMRSRAAEAAWRRRHAG